MRIADVYRFNCRGDDSVKPGDIEFYGANFAKFDIDNDLPEEPPYIEFREVNATT